MTASCPVHPAVIETALMSEPVGVPPSVSVTLVSSALVKVPGVVHDMAVEDPPPEVSRSPLDPAVAGRFQL